MKTSTRRAVRLSAESLVTSEPLRIDSRLPLLLQPAAEGVDLISWAADRIQYLESELVDRGGLLFRGFRLPKTDFQRFTATLSPNLMDYRNRSTPRTQVSDKVYTSTEYPAAESIPLHNELSYARDWPLKIAFMCVQAAATGGETPIADSRRVYNRIDHRIRSKFIEKGVMYVRNFGSGIDLDWATVFGTQDPREVESFCRDAGIEFEWNGTRRLRTRQVCQAVAQHPKTREMVWFNQAHLFHITNLNQSVQDSLRSAFSPADLPRNAFYGDGAEIEDSVLDAIREAFRQEEVAFPWEQGDVLVLDNMLAAHARRPFSGARQVVVSMAEPIHSEMSQELSVQ